jgi:hypothetical protein
VQCGGAFERDLVVGKTAGENGREHVKMGVSLEFWHFQPAA